MGATWGEPVVATAAGGAGGGGAALTDAGHKLVACYRAIEAGSNRLAAEHHGTLRRAAKRR